MDGARTRGHPVALAAIRAMIRGRAPHAVLLVGPDGVGKATLAHDLAAGLLCSAPDQATRPCGVCRACRLAMTSSHPDVHRLGPDGPGRQIVIGGPGAKVRGIRDLIGDLSLLSVEGGARLAIIESAQRMNDDAQAALLKTLEEPPGGVIIVLCADTEEALLPTIRSRCARLHLGPVGVRDVETILAEHGVTDPPLAARLARIAGGRPGVALAWARRPDALRDRDELGRTLLDLSDARPAVRLAAIRAATARASSLTVVADRTDALPGKEPAAASRSRRGTGAVTRASATSTPEPVVSDAGALEGDESDEPEGPTRAPAAERRRAVEALIALWTDVARDIALCQRGLRGSVRDLARLDDTVSLAATVESAAITGFLDRLGRAAVLIAANVSPELVLDDLVLAWPRPGSRRPRPVA